MSDNGDTSHTTDVSPCDEFLEAWLAEQESATDGVGSESEAEAISEAGQHVATCDRCSREASAMRRQAAQLAAHFSALSVPSRPALEPRAPLQAASGYPRRVSLNVLPFMLILLLLVLLGVGAIGWYLMTHFAS